MNATIRMNDGRRMTKTEGPVEYVRAIFTGCPEVIDLVAWAIATREECVGFLKGIEVTATVSE